MTDQTNAKQDDQEAKAVDQPKPNKDGLIPGQPVDMETMRRIEKKHAKARAEQDAKARTPKAKE